MDIQSLSAIASTITGLTNPTDVLQAVVEGLGAQPHVALARIWLIRPGDICNECRYAADCPKKDFCLHLAASDGTPVDPDLPRWRNLDGEYRRFPMNFKKIGRIASNGEAINVTDFPDYSELGNPEWGRKERIESLSGQPLIFAGEILGALCVFTRRPMTEAEITYLRIFANHAASAIANARAFQTIVELKQKLEWENAALKEEMSGGPMPTFLLGDSEAMQTIRRQIDIVAGVDANVLIEGESGTGKELAAQAIHRASPRVDGPLVQVNCASIPRELFESEFFGHVKGAFTGATRDRIGRFQLADGGTLFLDEVGEIPIELQSKLLRVIQEGSFEAIGDERTREVDVRIIAATNRNLPGEVRAGRFREDLYYRLNVFPIRMPPLRDRAPDIPLLAEHFLKLACRRHGVPPPALHARHIRRLAAHDWPGNVRELQNIIERAVIDARRGPFEIPLGFAPTPPATMPASRSSAVSALDCTSYDDLRSIEREMLLRVLQASNWTVSGPNGAARTLGVKPTTLKYRMDKLDLRKPAR